MSRVVRSLVALPFLLALGADARAQEGTRQPDVYVAPLVRRGATLEVGALRNISARPGYDNQPSFSPDGASLYYTSTRADEQADIYRVDLASGRESRVTTTAPESEYSAAVTPDGAAISVIRVERDSTQRLWRVPLDGAPSSVILERVKPVGYHAWADDRTLALFVLGTPASLQLADVRTGRADTVDTNIGRSLHRIPGTAHVSYVRRAPEATSWIVDLDPVSRAMRTIVRLPQGVEDYAWLPDGRIVAGDGARLMLYDPRGSNAWVAVADLSAQGVGTITRLAVSPAGDRLAIVAVPNASR